MGQEAQRAADKSALLPDGATCETPAAAPNAAAGQNTAQARSASAEAIAAEQELAALLGQGGQEAVIAWIEAGCAAKVEFTGRCLSLAICSGMAQASCRLAQAGFRLCVTDDAAAQEAIAAADGMRGLLGFLERYRYCKAQRSYYLPVVQSPQSAAPLKAMLEDGLLGKRDAAELLSLALRMSNAVLARTLADAGAHLADGADGDIPADLAGAPNSGSPASCAKDEPELWGSFATPQRDLATLQLVLEHTVGTPCRICRSWWGSYQRQEGFIRKLAAIACASDAAHCDCTRELLLALAAAGEQKALEAVLGWEGLEPAWLDEALAAAQGAGKTQAAAAIMRARHGVAQVSPLGPLEL